MQDDISRRRFLGATGSAAALFPLTAGAVQEHDPCGEYLALDAELEAARGRVQQAESELDERRQTYDRLLEEVRERYHDVRGPPLYPEPIRERAMDVAVTVKDAVVFLDMEWDGVFGPRSGTATGWFCEDGVIVTNAHNVENVVDAPDPTLRAWTADGDDFEFEIVGYVRDQDPDVAALSADVRPPDTIPFGSTAGLASGTPVVQVGHPGGFGNWVMTLGEVIEKRRTLRTTVPGLQGVSGSPLVDLDGNAVGLTFAGTGGEDAWMPGRVPEPAEPTVYQYPFQIADDALHETIETVQGRLEDWV